MSKITKRQAKWVRADFEGLSFPSMMHFKRDGTSYGHKVVAFATDGIQTPKHILTYKDMDEYQITFNITNVRFKKYTIKDFE